MPRRRFKDCSGSRPGRPGGVDLGFGRAPHPGALVERRLADQGSDRDVGGALAVHAQDEAPRFGDPADHREVELPFGEDAARLGLAAGRQDHQHPLLAFAEHDLVGAHRGFAHRHAVEIEFDAEPAFAGHLDRRGGEAGGPHVLDRDDRVALHQFEASLDQELFGERVADLDRRAFLGGVRGKLGRGHRRAVDAVAPGLGPDIDDEVSRARGGGIEDAVGAREADAHRVDQDVAVIGGMELALAADRRHPDAIAVAADPADHPRHEVPRHRMVGAAETQRVQHGNRPRAHREDVAQYAADPGRRALVGLDERGVVVALDLEDDRVAVADVDDPGILARAADHPRAGGRQGAEPDLRRFVRAVLAPHRGEYAELGQVRGAPEDRAGALEFVRAEPVLGGKLGGDVAADHVKHRCRCTGAVRPSRRGLRPLLRMTEAIDDNKKMSSS